MILFVFEGNRECPIFDSIQKLFFPKEIEPFICVYKSNIYSLYSHIKEYDLIGNQEEVNTVSVLNEILIEQGNHELSGIESSQVSEIFLFFDYDFHHKRGTLEENNAHLKELIEYFDEETGHGKLYINYPMVESLIYTKTLPDYNYLNYVVSRLQCSAFKKQASEFSSYNSFDHLLLSNNPKESEEKKNKRAKTAGRNWLHLIKMNVTKANYLCNDSNMLPTAKSDICQSLIYEAQLSKFVLTADSKVSVLNSFPIFLYEYLKELPI